MKNRILYSIFLISIWLGISLLGVNHSVQPETPYPYKDSVLVDGVYLHDPVYVSLFSNPSLFIIKQKKYSKWSFNSDTTGGLNDWFVIKNSTRIKDYISLYKFGGTLMYNTPTDFSAIIIQHGGRTTDTFQLWYKGNLVYQFILPSTVLCDTFYLKDFGSDKLFNSNVKISFTINKYVTDSLKIIYILGN